MAEPKRIEATLERDWNELLEAIPVPPVPRGQMPLSRAALLAQLEEVREDWNSLRTRIGAREAARYANAGWTLKELLAHAASWAREFRHEVETVMRGESFDYAIPFAMTVFGPNEWNQAQVQLRSEKTLGEIFDELDAETARLQEILIDMTDAALYGEATFPFAPSGDPAAKWRTPPAVIVMGKCMHDRHHIAQIRARLSEWSA